MSGFVQGVIIVLCGLLGFGSAFATPDAAFIAEGNEQFIDIKLNGFKIYSRSPTKMGLPTRIEFKNFTNINGCYTVWPKPVWNEEFEAEVYLDDLRVKVKCNAEDPSKPVEGDINLFYLACGQGQCIPIEQEFHVYQSAKEMPPSEISLVWHYLVLAFLGGFLLNFMPCVLGVLAIKFNTLLRCNSKEKMRRCSLIAFGAIMAYYLVIALVALILKHTGDYFMLGTSMQNPTFVATLIMTIVLMAAMLKGQFRLNISLGWVKYHQSVYVETFVSTIVASIISTSCLGPFLGTVLSFSLTQPTIVILLLYMTIGAGFGLPYLLCFCFPGVHRFLPRGGRWQEWFHDAAIVLSYVLVGYLLWLIYLQKGIGSAVFVLLCATSLGFVLASKKKYRLLISIMIFLGLVVSLELIDKKTEKIAKEQDSIWQDFSMDLLKKLRQQDEVIFVDVTASWCPTCIYNKKRILEGAEFISFAKERNMKMLRADFTNQDAQIKQFLIENNAQGIPFNIIYPCKTCAAVVLPALFNMEDIKQAVR